MAAYRPPNPPPNTTICAGAGLMRVYPFAVDWSSDLCEDVGIKYQHRSERGDGNHQQEAHQLCRQTPRHNLRAFLKILRLLAALPEERTVGNDNEQRHLHRVTLLV